MCKNSAHKLNFCLINLIMFSSVKFIYSEKATKFCEIFILLLTVCTVVKSKVKISQNFVAFSEYRVFHSEMRETKALDGHLKLNFHP